MPNIEALKELEALHRNFDQTGIEEFYQNKWPGSADCNYGKCGCVGHTYQVCNDLSDDALFRHAGYFGIRGYEYDFIFGLDYEVSIAANELGYDISDEYQFTATDAADRIAYIISLYEKGD